MPGYHGRRTAWFKLGNLDTHSGTWPSIKGSGTTPGSSSWTIVGAGLFQHSQERRSEVTRPTTQTVADTRSYALSKDLGFDDQRAQTCSPVRLSNFFVGRILQPFPVAGL